MISTHTPLAGRDCFDYLRKYNYFKFQLTRPSRGVTNLDVIVQAQGDISTHTPLAGRDIATASEQQKLINFNSHAPRGA